MDFGRGMLCSGGSFRYLRNLGSCRWAIGLFPKISGYEGQQVATIHSRHIVGKAAFLQA